MSITTAAELRANAHGARASMNTALAEIFENCAQTLEMTEEMYYMILAASNAEGVRAMKAEAAANKLRAVITAHNERVAAACTWRQENGHCDYAKRGDLCPDCPREWEIDDA